MGDFKIGDVVKIASISATKKSKYGTNEYMEKMVGQKFVISEIRESDDAVMANGCYWNFSDLEVVGEVDENLQIPFCNNHNTARENNQYDILLERIGYVGDYLTGLHNTDVFKKGKQKIQRYDGSGKLFLEGMPDWVMTKLRFDILQKKKVGFMRDKPDVIIMLDNSGSIAGAKMCNHLRVLSAAISDVFFAELNKVYLITFGHKGNYYEFNDKMTFVDFVLQGTRFDEGSTRYDLAFMEAMKNDCLKGQTRPRLIILITDGVPTDLVNDVEIEIDKQSKEGYYKGTGHNHPSCKTTKSVLLKSIDMISSLSALDNTVFRILVLSQSSDTDMTYDRIADEIAKRLAGARDMDENAMILLRRFINEMMLNSLVLSFDDFSTGRAFSTITEDIKREFYKLQALR